MQTVLPDCLVDQRVVVFDVETTGFKAGVDRVIQVGVLWVEDNDVVMKLSFLCNPGTPVPQNITDLTGITQEMLDGAGRFEDISDFLIDILAPPSVLVAYNGGFDVRFIAAELNKCRAFAKPQFGDLIDPLPWVRIEDHGMSCKLADAAARRGVSHKAHNALSDCVMTFKVLCKLDLPDTLEGVLEAQKRIGTGKRGRR